jgi:hypothetical protein
MPTASIIHDHQRDSARSMLSRAARLHLSSLKRFAGKFRVPVFYMRHREQVIGIQSSPVLRGEVNLSLKTP